MVVFGLGNNLLFKSILGHCGFTNSRVQSIKKSKCLLFINLFVFGHLLKSICYYIEIVFQRPLVRTKQTLLYKNKWVLYDKFYSLQKHEKDEKREK